MTDTATRDGRRLRGDASRRAVLRLAVDQASLSGLDSLTIGTLAADAGVSKSNVATLFGSKLDLQLATIEAAREIFIDAVIAPALAEPHGLARLVAIVELWLDYSESRVFAGGCFFRAVAADASAKDDAGPRAARRDRRGVVRVPGARGARVPSCRGSPAAPTAPSCWPSRSPRCSTPRTSDRCCTARRAATRSRAAASGIG